MKFLEGCASKIQVPAGKNEVVVFDETRPGFGIRKFADRRAVYFVRFTGANGARRKLVLSPCTPGILSAMRRRAAEIIADAKRGHDPLVDKKNRREAAVRAREHSVGVLIEQYLLKRRTDLKPRTFREIDRHLRKHWAPLHDYGVRNLTRAELVKVIDGIAMGSGRTAADRAKAALSTFLGWCLERELIDANPVAGIKQRTQSGPRERVVSEQELVAIWRASNNNDYGWIIRLLMLTGQRREEIGGLMWDEIDFDKRQIILPGRRTKNGREHIIPLSDAAITILQGVSPRLNRDLVFGIGVGGFSGWSKSKERLDDRILRTLGGALYAEFLRHVAKRGKKESDRIAKELKHTSADALRASIMKPWTVHDLRRSFATHCSDHDFAPRMSSKPLSIIKAARRPASSAFIIARLTNAASGS
jgi:integrase